MSNDSGTLDRVFSCPCGHKMRVSEFQLGMDIHCPICKAEHRLRESNTEPLVRNAPPAPKTPRTEAFALDKGEMTLGAASASAGGDVCERCGKAFRGDWDKHSTIMGEVCNVCANLAVDGGPETLKLASKAPSAPAYDPFTDPTKAQPLPAPEESASHKPRWMEEHPTESKLILWGLAMVVILLSLWATTVEPPAPVVRSDEQIAAAQAAVEQLGELPFVVVYGFNLAFWFLGIGVPLFLLLKFTDKLPFDSWWANGFEVGWVALFLAFVGATTGVVPMVGGIIGLFISLYFLWNRYDFGFFHFVLYCLISLICGILLFALRAVVLGVAAQFIL